MDIVERLRDTASCPDWNERVIRADLAGEAADEIEWLREMLDVKALLLNDNKNEIGRLRLSVATREMIAPQVEAMEAEIERLTAALREIAGDDFWSNNARVARRALGLEERPDGRP